MQRSQRMHHRGQTRFRVARPPAEHFAVVDARFERLDKDAKRVAEIASVFGGEIPVLSLKRMAALPELRFDAALQDLKRADLLVEVQIFPDASLRFKHALIRNAITGRIISTALVELHKSALIELKAYYADRLEEHSERLAKHAQQAQLWDEAVAYLLVSANKAIKRSAHASARSSTRPTTLCASKYSSARARARRPCRS